jgi:hypothetical protein
VDPFQSIFAAAMADLSDTSPEPSPSHAGTSIAGHSPPLSYEGHQSESAASALSDYGRQSVSAKSASDALDALDRVCVELQGVENREAAAERNSRSSGSGGGGGGVISSSGGGGNLRRTWALGPTTASHSVARAGEEERNHQGGRGGRPRPSAPQLGGQHSFYSRGGALQVESS